MFIFSMLYWTNGILVKIDGVSSSFRVNEKLKFKTKMPIYENYSRPNTRNYQSKNGIEFFFLSRNRSK